MSDWTEHVASHIGHGSGVKGPHVSGIKSVTAADIAKSAIVLGPEFGCHVGLVIESERGDLVVTMRCPAVDHHWVRELPIEGASLHTVAEYQKDHDLGRSA